MKKLVAPLFAILLLVSCKNKKNIPDVSGIKASLTIQRFDEDFFSLDTTDIENGLSTLQAKYPDFLPLFFQNIIGVSDKNGIKTYYRLYKPVFDSSQKLYKDFNPVKKQIEQALRYVKYYFPAYKLPASIKTVVGPMNSMQDFAMMGNGDYVPDFLGTDFIGISLQFYLGKDFSLYNTEYFINNVAPLYRSRRFSKEYIIGDVMKLITEDIFPDKSKGKPLIEQMIEKGKQWWMMDKFLPEIPDSIKTGYTKQQLDWCNENEGLIWSWIQKHEDVNSINPVTIQTYIGEGPFTQGFSQELSPGNLGQWIGWQIVKKFVNNNPGMKPEEIMQTSPRKILEEAKYKPK
ncbi:MAG: hypothetical protein Q8941_01010 [Bacteroidota bacterium]|nr:hypothetical protein [Bacteroidota bacterium]